MARKKNHYYVLVVSDSGPAFVTKINYADKTAEWNHTEKPLEMGKENAEDLVLGLCLNWNMAYLVCQPFEIDSQPYNYKDWKVQMMPREDFDEEEEEEA